MRPAGHLAARVERVAHARVLARSPDGYDCVHARVEEDWLRKWCAAHGNQERRANATVEELTHGLCRDGTRVSSPNYLSVQQMSRACVRSCRPIVLYTSARERPSARCMLVDLEVLFDVQMRAELEAARPQRKSFMNFEDALVDRGVCAQGLHFFSSAQDVELRERSVEHLSVCEI